MLSIANEVNPLIFRRVCYMCDIDMYFSNTSMKGRLSLEREFSKEEVILVLKEMGGDKAPSPDDSLRLFSINVGVLWKRML